MAYIPLTKEQYEGLKSKGYTQENIISFEKKRKSETQDFGQKAKEFGKTAYREAVAPVVHGASTFAFGIPKAVAEKTGAKEIIYPEQETIGGKLLRGASEVAGFTAGAPLKVGAKIAERFVPKLVSKAGVVPATKRFLAESLRRKVGRAAIQYGTASGLTLPEKTFTQPIGETAGQVAGQTVVGAGLGAGGESIGVGIPKLVRSARKAKVRKIGISPTTKAGKIVEKISKPMLERISKIDENITNLSNEAKVVLTGLKDKTSQAGQKVVRYVKGRLPKFSREFSDSYGNRLEGVSKNVDDLNTEAISKGGEPIFSRKTVTNILENAKQEMDNELITPSPQFNSLYDNFVKGISPETNPEVFAIEKAFGLKKGQLKGAGIDWSRVSKGESQWQPPDPNAPLSFEETVKKIRGVSKPVYKGSKGATTQWTEDDLSNFILQKHFGDFAGKIVPDFAVLQSEASPAIQYIKYGKRLFKPGIPDISESAIGAVSKPDIAEQDLLSMLQSGIEKFKVKGMGEVTQPVTKAQQKVVGTQKGYDIAKQKLTQQKTSLAEALEKSRGKVSGQAEKALQLRKIKELSEAKTNKWIRRGLLGGGGTLTYLWHRQLWDALRKTLNK